MSWRRGLALLLVALLGRELVVCWVLPRAIVLTPAAVGWRGGAGERLTVGSPEVELRYAIIGPPAEQARGSLLVAHGIWADRHQLGAIVHAAASDGWRVLAVDLRGHGGSEGAFGSYGVREGEDLAQILSALEGELPAPICALGYSYGGAAVLQLARADERVARVVTVSTFSDLRAIVPAYARRMLPLSRWWLRDAEIARAVDAAGAQAGFDPDAANSAMALADTAARGASVLVVHGTGDRNIAPDHARRLVAAGESRAPGRVALHWIDGATHNGIVRGEHGRALAARALSFLAGQGR